MLFYLTGYIAVPATSGQPRARKGADHVTEHTKGVPSTMPTATLIIRRTVGQITLTAAPSGALSGPSGSLDLAPFFTIARDRQGPRICGAATIFQK